MFIHSWTELSIPLGVTFIIFSHIDILGELILNDKSSNAYVFLA